ncbi:MAG: hypothetical protein AB9903_05800 [Vulcanimicrobiota bacterium]
MKRRHDDNAELSTHFPSDSHGDDDLAPLTPSPVGSSSDYVTFCQNK